MTATSASRVKWCPEGARKIFCLSFLGGGGVVECRQACIGQPRLVFPRLPVDCAHVGLLDLPRDREVPVPYHPVVHFPYRRHVRCGPAEEELVCGEYVLADEVVFL